ncbi:MAG: hypothetical protein D6775_02570 [Caldilineae bacterium]|nr:MAG: hypothetical protein D6775_02570 [Caldilineae bacterium]
MSRRRTRKSLAHAAPDMPTAALLVGLATLPAFFNIQSSVSFEPDKGALLHGVALVALAPLVVDRLRRRGRETDSWPPRSPAFLFLAAYAAFALVATVAAVDPVTALWGNHERGYGLLSVFAGVILLVVAYQATRRGHMWLVVDTILLSGIIPVVYGLAQVLGFDPVQAHTVSFTLGQRASSSLGNPLFLADFLLSVLTLTLLRLLAGPPVPKSSRYALVGYCLLVGVVLATTQSRSALLGVLAAAAFLLIGWGRREGRESVRWAGVAVLLGGAFLLFVAWAVPEVLPPRLGDLFASGGSGGQRLLIWQAVFDTLAARPVRWLTGFGFDSLPLALAAHVPAALAHFEVDWVFRVPDRAHTLPLDLVGQTGVPGLVLWLLFNAALLERLLPAWPGRRWPGRALMVGGAVAGAVCAGLLAGRAAVPLGISAGFLGGALALLVLAPNPSKVAGARRTSNFLAAALVGHWVLLTFSFATHAAELVFLAIAGLALGQDGSTSTSRRQNSSRLDPPPHLYPLLAGIPLATFAFSLSAAGVEALFLWTLCLIGAYFYGYWLAPNPDRAAQHWYWSLLPSLMLLPAVIFNRGVGARAWLAYTWFLMWMLIQIALVAGLPQPPRRLSLALPALLAVGLINLPIFGDIAYKSAILTQDDAARHTYLQRALLLSPHDHVVAAGIVPTENAQLPPDAGLEHPRARRIRELFEHALAAQPLAVEPYAAYANWLRLRVPADPQAEPLARAMFARSLSLAPQDLMTRNRLALLDAATGREEEAIAALEALLTIDPLYGPTYLNLAGLYRTRGDIDKARALLQTGSERVPWWDTLSRALAELETDDSAP